MITGAGALLQATTALFLNPVTRELGWSRGTFSTGPLVSAIAIIVTQPFMGWLMDRYGVRRAVLPFVLLLAVGYAAMSFITANAILYFAILFFIGIANCAQTPPIFAKVVSLWFDGSRGIALGVAMCGGALGFILMPLYANYLIELYGWRRAFIGLGLSNLAFMLPIVLFVLREPAAPSTNPAAAHAVIDIAGHTLREAMGTVRFWMLVAIALLAGTGLYAIMGHSVVMLTDGGWTTRQAVTLLSAAGLANILGRLASGWLLDATSGPAIPALMLLFPGIAAVLLLIGRVDILPYFAIPLVTFAHGADGDLLAYLSSRYFGLRNYGQIYGFQFGAVALGSGVGPALMGQTHDAFGSYSVGLMAVAVGCVLAFLLCVRLGKYEFRPHHEPASPLADLMADDVTRTTGGRLQNARARA
ncbi:MAG TPA: MFS transporter [Sphingobium sp.]